MKFHFNREFSEELKQKQAITDSLIQKILYSKRLLVDHVEALEQCLRHMNDGTSILTDAANAGKRGIVQSLQQDEIFTVRNTCILLGGTILEHFITPKVLRLTLLPSVLLTGGFSALFVVKNIFVFRNKIVERELDDLIRIIDEFGNCIRRNMTYFNEIILMKQQELIESRQIERAWDCITAAKEVTEILYEATRKLETQYPIPARFSQYYSPMEELRECEYFKKNITDYSPKHIKDFHNIFAYVQSQFLLRLALTISTKPSISQLNTELTKIESLIRQLVQEEETHFRNLNIELNKKHQLEIEQLNTTKAMQNRRGPVAVLQESSLKLSARMVAVASECQSLDITLQRLNEVEAEKKDNAKQLVEVANNMSSIENALLVCFHDFQRLMLVYSKFLSNKLDSKDEKCGELKNNSDNSDDEFPESFLRVEISKNQPDAEREDDFYAYMFDEQYAKTERERAEKQYKIHESDILNFEERITKERFRPILKQIKARIDPIRKEMLEKERKVLAAKGIDVDKLLRKDDENGEDDADAAVDNKPSSHKKVTINDNRLAKGKDEESDSEGSADLEFERRSKKLKERDNFAEMRNFLAQKQAINLMKLDIPKPVNATGSEDILESEC